MQLKLKAFHPKWMPCTVQYILSLSEIPFYLNITNLNKTGLLLLVYAKNRTTAVQWLGF